jgi:D-beta-D-heptose 7-phosphate kinase/D-beta-D-heptose 1-phosphate adenosyltransferase
MVDRYLFGEANRISPEAPVMILEAVETEFRAGGGAGVATFLRAFGAKVSVAGVIGNDSMGNLLIDRMVASGIDCEAVISDADRVTTTKERFLGTQEHRQPRQILRVDHETRTPITESVADLILAYVSAHSDSTDVILVADYAKGVCTEYLIQRLIRLGRTNGIPVLVDPGRGVSLSLYAGAWLLKPNRTEASAMIGRSIHSVEQAIDAAALIMAKADVDNLIITLDVDGAVFASRNGLAKHVSTGIRQVADITGAGDMFLAALALAVGSGMSREQAVEVANCAAGLEVERVGSSAISLDELIDSLNCQLRDSASKIVHRDSLVRIRDFCRENGKRVVFTNGCFDLLHVGHVECLEVARSMGDMLVVGVNSDASVRRLKGNERPVFQQDHRIRMLAALSCVSFVVVFDEDDPCSLIRLLTPDVLVKGGTYLLHEVVGHEIVEQHGGRVEVVPMIEGISTSSLLSRIRKRGLCDVATNDNGL